MTDGDGRGSAGDTIRAVRPRAQGPKSPRDATLAALAALADRAPASLLALAARVGRPVHVPAGTRLFAAGDPVPGLHLVLSGLLRVVRAASDRAIVVHREGPGGLLGEIALFTDGRYPATAEALEPTDTLLLPADALRRALGEDPALAEALLRRVAARAREVIARLDRVAHLTVVRRVALHLAERARRSRGDVVTLGMTQAQLADELGTVKELVVRELRTLRRLRLVEPEGGGRYRVLDLAGLERLAGEVRQEPDVRLPAPFDGVKR